MKSLLDLIRWKNVLITGIYQYLLYFFLIKPAFEQAGLSLQLQQHEILLFIFCTICIVICANVINDLFDNEIDKINKPNSPIASGKIRKESALKIYYSFLLLGLLTAIYIAYSIGKIYLVSIYFIMQGLMYLYSHRLKKQGLIGNTVVALSIAFVSIVMIFAEPQLIENDALGNSLAIILGFSGFVFLINLSRELVKDLEDVEGDQSQNLTTFPIKYGKLSAKRLIIFLLILLVLALVAWVALKNDLDFRLKSYPLVILAGPICLAILKIFKAEIKVHYSKVSKLLKFIILLGLVYFYLIVQFYYH